MKYLKVTMSDGSKWGVPVSLIALSRATHYADEFGSVQESLDNDTLPLFESDPYEIEDWAANNMNWEDVSDHAVLIASAEDIDWQEGWLNGDKEIIEKD